MLSFYVMGVLVFMGDDMFDPFKLLGVATYRTWSFFAQKHPLCKEITQALWVFQMNISKLIDNSWFCPTAVVSRKWQ